MRSDGDVRQGPQFTARRKWLFFKHIEYSTTKPFLAAKYSFKNVLFIYVVVVLFYFIVFSGGPKKIRMLAF